jgi:hypothetical protein
MGVLRDASRRSGVLSQISSAADSHGVSVVEGEDATEPFASAAQDPSSRLTFRTSGSRFWSAINSTSPRVPSAWSLRRRRRMASRDPSSIHRRRTQHCPRPPRRPDADCRKPESSFPRCILPQRREPRWQRRTPGLRVAWSPVHPSRQSTPRRAAERRCLHPREISQTFAAFDRARESELHINAKKLFLVFLTLTPR